MDRQEIIAIDKRRVWHPYTAMQRYIDETAPLVIARAEGSRLYDADGRMYFDGNASWWTALLGHCHPRLVAALRAQSERMCHVALAGITHEPAALLAEELVAAAPAGLERVFYSDDGSTAVEVALKLALQLWHNEGRPRRRFIALDGAFHGETLGVTALGGVELFRKPFAGAKNSGANDAGAHNSGAHNSGAGIAVSHVPLPPEREDVEGYERAIAAVSSELERDDRTDGGVAAVVVEPVLQGAAGMRLYAPAYLRELRRLCDRHGALLVFDEVFTGFGRTGPMWACDHAQVSPDILCLAKGMSGGILPMGATLVNERVFSAFLGPSDRAFLYGHSYCGHPLGAAVAREVLAVYRDEDILRRAAPKAERIRSTVAALAALPGVSAVRALGMMGAIDLEPQGEPSGYLGRRGWQIYDEALRRGAYLRPLGDTVYVTPPLNIPDPDLERLLAILEESVRAILTP